MGIIRHTQALCPVCKRRLDAAYVKGEQTIDLWRCCPEHGDFSNPVWRNYFNFATWVKNAPVMREGENPACPSGCGLCADHKQGTCCVLLPVTSRCNLFYRHCFANTDGAADKSFDEIKESLAKLAVPGQTLVQLSDGEPTLRDDLPAITAEAKSAGCRYVQINTNGIRLAEDKPFVEKLAKAGLSFVLLQFDSLDDSVYQTLRGRPLLAVKKQTIANCADYGIGVTLVPIVVPGVNTREVGDIIRFAAGHSPAVRGVHFQPVSYFDRSPVPPQSASRYTLDELLRDIVGKSDDLVNAEDFSPSRCDHPLCGQKQSCCETEQEDAFGIADNAAARNREFVGRFWQRSQTSSAPQDNENRSCAVPEESAVSGLGSSDEMDLMDMEQFAARVKSHGFTITAMAFQDAATLDIARLRQCSLHVFSEGKHIPFCAYYL
jgi:uncharacterized radical SAM superfamily Fe-S cluster-containing enzyme